MLNTNSETFTQDFIDALNNSGISDADLARHCDLSKPAVHSYRNGAKPRPALLKLINEILNDDAKLQEIALKSATVIKNHYELTLQESTVEEIVAELKRRGALTVSVGF